MMSQGTLPVFSQQPAPVFCYPTVDKVPMPEGDPSQHSLTNLPGATEDVTNCQNGFTPQQDLLFVQQNYTVVIRQGNAQIVFLLQW